MANGALMCLHPSNFSDLDGGFFEESSGSITDIRFSLDGLFMATADSDLCVGIYYMGEEWTFLGKYRAHTAPITGLEFGMAADGKTPLLVSVSEDQHLMEYDLERSSVRDGIQLKRQRVRIAQTAVPTTCLWHPAGDNQTEEIVLTANDQFKLTAWSATYQTCRRT